jgi:hypothetical protein
MKSKLIHSQIFKLLRILWSTGEDKRLLPTYLTASVVDAIAFIGKSVSCTVSLADLLGMFALGATCE